MSDRPLVVVAAAVIQREDAYLVTRRLKGAHLEGLWEFPGGKCHPGETLADCLVREMREELDAGVRVGTRLLTTRHVYPARAVELHFFACELTSEPVPVFGQEMRWVPRTELQALHFPPADDELIRLLSSF